jgi:DNA polymerase III delta prime subunit
MIMSSNVWVEKYRPTEFNDIVLDPLNKRILKNIIDTTYFPNLLFYGPPGTGKTTTIINLVNSYQEKLNEKNKELMIHLNASDERGIDIIRSQINQFVNSKTLFNKGMKFVILDEVDYMTKNAQQALRYLLQNYSGSVRFCLICNYISRIDEGLQNEFLRLRFNQLPENDIIQFLSNISEQENLHLTENSLRLIQKLYKSDIRSMINFMQSNQNIKYDDFNIIDETVWNELYDKIKKNNKSNNLDNLVKFINETSVKFNIDKKNIIKDFLNFLIRNKKTLITPKYLNFIENIMHFEDCKNSYYVNYALIRLSSLVTEL